MTQEKLKRVVTAATVAGTLIVVCLLAVIMYQVVHIAVLNRRIKDTQQEIERYTTQKEQSENDLNYYLSDLYLEDAARKEHFIKPGDIVAGTNP